MTKKHLYSILLLLTTWQVSLNAIPRFNLFNPYDILVQPPHWPDADFQSMVGFEHAYTTHAAQADDEQKHNAWRRLGNPLQLWQDAQNATAAFNGIQPSEPIEDALTLFKREGRQKTSQLLIPCAHLDIQANLMLSLQYYFDCGVLLAAYIPYYVMRLNNVHWQSKTVATRRAIPCKDLLPMLEDAGSIDLYHGWNRSGFGDLSIFAWWFKDYLQAKKKLGNVRVGLRGGVAFPTGKPEALNELLALPFGNDGSAGIIFGGNLQLWMRNYIIWGLDVELSKFFGTIRTRRIKTYPGQTDLLFLEKVPAYKELGLRQHYTLYLEAPRFLAGLSGRIAYQYTKQQEDHLSLCSTRFDPRIANCAESLDEWTIHSLIFQISYDFFYPCYNSSLKPFISAFYKLGLNGKRSLLSDTYGFTLSVSF
jgi:hypothetical protein